MGRKETDMNVRPKTIENFLGQSNIVEQVKVAVKSAKIRDTSFPHMLMGGPPGLGKTTLAEIIVNEMGGVLVSRIATAITKAEDLVELFASITQLNTFIFIDEIEQLDRKLTELLHTAMEDRKFSAKLKTGIVNIDLPEFSLMGATNYLGELPRPFLDRFKIKVNFEPYSCEEIYTILVGAVKKLQIKATKNGVRELSLRSRGVPRIAIGYLEDARDVALAYRDEYNDFVSGESVARMFQIKEIDHLGLTDLDRRILDYLERSGKPCGLKTISQGVDEDDSTVELSEGYMVRIGLITKTAKGREITKKGKKHMMGVEECLKS
jgi:Holliday junction DNA helicase RuvB